MERRQLGGIAQCVTSSSFAGDLVISLSYDFVAKPCLCSARTLAFCLCIFPWCRVVRLGQGGLESSPRRRTLHQETRAEKIKNTGETPVIGFPRCRVVRTPRRTSLGQGELEFSPRRRTLHQETRAEKIKTTGETPVPLSEEILKNVVQPSRL